MKLKISDFVRIKWLYKCRMSDLNDWEGDFVEQISTIVYLNRYISPKQIDKIREVYDKHRAVVKGRLI